MNVSQASFVIISCSLALTSYSQSPKPKINMLSDNIGSYTADVELIGDGPTYCTTVNSTTGNYEIPVKNEHGDVIVIIGKICSNYTETNYTEPRRKFHYIDSHTTTGVNASSSKGVIHLTTTFYRKQASNLELFTVSDGNPHYTCPDPDQQLISDDRTVINVDNAILLNSDEHHAIQHISVTPKAGAGC